MRLVLRPDAVDDLQEGHLVGDLARVASELVARALGELRFLGALLHGHLVGGLVLAGEDFLQLSVVRVDVGVEQVQLPPVPVRLLLKKLRGLLEVRQVLGEER